MIRDLLTRIGIRRPQPPADPVPLDELDRRNLEGLDRLGPRQAVGVPDRWMVTGVVTGVGSGGPLGGQQWVTVHLEGGVTVRVRAEDAPDVVIAPES